jgi:hypothetical protein
MIDLQNLMRLVGIKLKQKLMTEATPGIDYSTNFKELIYESVLECANVVD